MTPEEHAYAAAAEVGPSAGPEPTRRLSPLRIIVLLAVIVAVAGGITAFRTATKPAPRVAAVSSFMPYVDVTETPQYAFENAAKSSSASLVLGFVVSARNAACTPSWGGAYSLSAAASSMDLDRRIARLRQRGGQVAISFGGAANSELAAGCTDPADLLAAYRSVIHRYSVDAIDLDLEGAPATAPAAVARRATAIHTLQQQERRAGRVLQVWLTLPVGPTGMTASGIRTVEAMLAAKVTVAGVNGMTMDYGQSLAAGQTLTEANTAALNHLATQLSAAYRAQGHALSAAAVWQHIGATPMIGQNDSVAERFSLADARSLLAFAQSHHLRRLSMWSVNRDQPCGPNYADVTVVSDNCSGVNQPPAGFTAVFARFRTSAPTTPANGSSVPTSAAPAPTSIVDDPATSPYPIWTDIAAYPQATKIVWHRNVYEAKWWTQGDTPDAPVAAATDTPWTLIGPVLPGEHPAPTPTLAAGTFPAWSATATYRAGDRVLYRGVGYQAKWYSRGNVPGRTVSDPGQTPWEHITTR